MDENIIESFRAEIESLKVRLHEVERMASDHNQRFDTLQTSLRKRILFRIDGWPGQNNLNADKPKWRLWRRWWTS